MPPVNIPPYAWRPVQTNQWVRNGKYPDAWFQSVLAERANQVARWKAPKEVASFSCPLAALPAYSGSSRNRWRFAFHTSPLASYLWMRVLLAPVADAGGAVVDPYAKLLIETATPATVGTAEYHFGAALLGVPDTPAYFGLADAPLASGGAIAVVPPDTDLFGVLSDEGSRLIAASVYEVSLEPDPANGYNTGPVVAQGPVFNTDRGDIVTMLRDAWTRGAAHLVNWSVDVQSSPRTRASATAINIIDNSSTAVSAATPGWTLDLEHKSTLRRQTVPVAVKIRAKQSAGTGVFRLKDSSGTTVASINITSPTEQWWSTTVNLPATVAKYDPTLESGSGANTASLYAVSVYQHE